MQRVKLQAAAWCFLLIACDRPVAPPAAAELNLSSAALLASLMAPQFTVATPQGLATWSRAEAFARAGELPFPAILDALQEGSNEATIDGAAVVNLNDVPAGLASSLARLGARYPTLESFWQDQGLNLENETPSAAAFARGLAPFLTLGAAPVSLSLQAGMQAVPSSPRRDYKDATSKAIVYQACLTKAQDQRAKVNDMSLIAGTTATVGCVIPWLMRGGIGRMQVGFCPIARNFAIMFGLPAALGYAMQPASPEALCSSLQPPASD